LHVAGDGWGLGPLQLRGDSWQLRAEVAAAGQKLHAALSARGPRIGELDGRLDAVLRGPWALDRQMPWRGEVRTAISDLAWLGELAGERWQTAGRLQASLQLEGTPERPSVSGTLRGDDLALSFPEQGMRLARGRLAAQLDDNLLTIETLGFDSLLEPVPRPLRLADPDGAGQLAARPGRLEIAGRLRVDRDSGGDSAKLDLRLERFGAYQLPDQWLVLSGDGQLSWADNVLGIRGKLLTDAAWWQLADAGVPRLSDDVHIRAGSAAGKSGVPRPSLDLDLEADLGRQFHFRGAGLSTRLAGSLRVQARGRDLPRGEGRIRMRDGRFDAYGQRLEIERGIVTFRGLLDNPGLDVRAVRTGLPVEPGVQVSGTAQRPVVRLVSDPEMPDAEKLSWLVLGHGPEQGSAADAAVLLAAAGSLLGNEKGNVVQQIKRATGIDEFGVRQGAIGGSGGSLPSSRVVGGSFDSAATASNQILSVGKRLSNDVLLAYEQSLNKAESVVKLTVRLNRQLALIARAGTDNALDMLYTISFGGPPGRAERRRQPNEAQGAGESAGGR
jgi:translocation and assembly module TamB